MTPAPAQRLAVAGAWSPVERLAIARAVALVEERADWAALTTDEQRAFEERARDLFVEIAGLGLRCAAVADGAEATDAVEELVPDQVHAVCRFRHFLASPDLRSPTEWADADAPERLELERRARLIPEIVATAGWRLEHLPRPALPAVFFSYSHGGGRFEHNLLLQLRSAARVVGADTWFDDRLVGGDRWLDEILLRIGAATHATILLSRRTLSSVVIGIEVAFLRARSDRCVVMTLDVSAYSRPQLGQEWNHWFGKVQALHGDVMAEITGLDDAERESRRDAAIAVASQALIRGLGTPPAGLTEPSPVNRPDRADRADRANLRNTPPGPASRSVPRSERHIVPRPALHERLVGALDEGARVTLVHGDGGVGKTKLAIQLVGDDAVRRRFPGGVVWTTVGEHPSFPEVRADLIAQLRELGVIPEPDDDDIDDDGIADVPDLSAHLAIFDGLVVIDDVWSPSALRRILGRPSASGPRFLVTSRFDLGHGDTVPDLRGVRLERLDDAEAWEFLRAISAQEPALLSGAAERKDLLDRAGRGVALNLALIIGLRRAGKGWDAIDRLVTDAQRAHGGDQNGFASEVVMVSVGLDDYLSTDRSRWPRIRLLGAMPEDTRLSLSTLANLWDLPDGEIDEIVGELAARHLIESAGIGSGDRSTPTIGLHDNLWHALARRTLDSFELHADVVDRYRDLTTGGRWATLPLDDDYIWAHLLAHLAAIGDWPDAAATATDPMWIARRWVGHGRTAVGADLDAARRGGSAMDPKHVEHIDLAAQVVGVLGSAIEKIADDAAVGPTARITSVEISVAAWIGRAAAGRVEPKLLPGLGHESARLAPGGGIIDMAWSPDDERLMLYSSRAVTTWERRSGDLVSSTDIGAPLFGGTRCAWPSAGSRLVSPGSPESLDSRSSATHMWDAESGALLAALPPAPPGAISTDRIATSGAAGIEIWAMTDGRLETTITNVESAITHMSWNSDDSRLATIDRRGDIDVWDVARRTCVDRLCSSEVLPAGRSFAPERLFRLSPDGTGLAVGVTPVPDPADPPDRPDRQFLVVHDVGSLPAPAVIEEGCVAAWSRDSGRIAVAGHAHLEVRTVALEPSGPVGPVDPVDPLRIPLDRCPTSIRWSPDGEFISVTMGSDPNDSDATGVDVYAVGRGRSTHGIGNRVRGMSPEAVWNHDGTGLAIWSGGVLRLVTPHVASATPLAPARIATIAWNHGGTAVAAASLDGTLTVVDATTRATVGGLQRPDDLGRDARQVFNRVTWSADDASVTAEFQDAGLRTLHVPSGHEMAPEPRLDWPGGPVRRSEDGRLGIEVRDRAVNIVDVATGDRVCRLDGLEDIDLCKWSPDGALLIAAAEPSVFGPMTGSYGIWSTRTGERVNSLDSEQAVLRRWGWDPTGRFAASVAHSGVVELWDVSAGARLATFPSGDASSDVSLWRADDGPATPVMIAVAVEHGFGVWCYHPT